VQIFYDNFNNTNSGNNNIKDKNNNDILNSE